MTIRRAIMILNLFLGVTLLSGCALVEKQTAIIPTTPTINPSPTNTAIPTSTLMPTPTPTPIPTFTPHLTSTPTSVPTSTFTPSPVLPVSGGTPFPMPAAAISEDDVHRITQLGSWGKRQVEQVEWSSDFKFLAVRSSKGIGLYDTQTLEELWFRGDIVGPIALSPDGSIIGVTTGSGIEIWQVENGKLIQTLDVNGRLCITSNSCTYPLPNLAFSPDGSLLAAVVLSETEEDRTILFWQMPDGNLISTLKEAVYITDLLFAPAGDTVAFRTYSSIELWDIADWKLLRSFDNNSGDFITAFDFSPDGSMIATQYEGGDILIWRVEDGEIIRSLPNQYSDKFDFELWWTLGLDSLELNFLEGIPMDLSAEGSLLALYLQSEQVLQIWDINTRSLLHTLETGLQQSSGYWNAPYWDWERSPGHNALSIFSPDGSTLVSVSQDGLRLWQILDGTLVKSNLWDGNEIVFDFVSTAFSEDGNQLLVNLREGHHAIRVNDGEVLYSAEGPLVSLPDGTILEIQPKQNDVDLMQVDNGNVFLTLSSPGEIGFAQITSDGAALVTWDQSYTAVKLWRMSDGSRIKTLSNGLLLSMAISPDGRLIALSGSSTGASIGPESGSVRIWQISDGSVAQNLGVGLDDALAFTPDGALLGVVNHSDEIILYQVEDQTIIQTFKLEGMFQGSRNSCATGIFTQDGSILICGGRNGNLIFLRVSDGAILREFQAHSSSVYSLALSPDGRLLVSGSNDGTLRLWGLGP